MTEQETSRNERRFIFLFWIKISPVDRPQEQAHTSCRYATGETGNPSRNAGPHGPEDAGGTRPFARLRPGEADRGNQRQSDRTEPGDDLRVAAAASAAWLDFVGLGRLRK